MSTRRADQLLGTPGPLSVVRSERRRVADTKNAYARELIPTVIQDLDPRVQHLEGLANSLHDDYEMTRGCSWASARTSCRVFETRPLRRSLDGSGSNERTWS